MDQVAFPVARDGAVLDLGRALRDHDHVAQLPAVVRAPALAPTGAARAQTRGEVLAQRAAGLNEQRLIDRLVRDLHPRIIRELDPQAARDLLR
jgi:hypothetical protein